MRFDIPAHVHEVHRMVVPLRWGDMDAFGHVNNTNYFRYLEIGRIDWFQQLGLVEPKAKVGPVIVNAFCNFLEQLTYPGDLLVVHLVGDVGRTSFDTFARMERADRPGVAVATGGATVVWIDYAAGKGVPLPEALVGALKA